MSTKKRNTFRKRVYILIVILFTLVGIIVFAKLSAYIKPLYQLTFEKDIELKKTEEKHINMLLLGIGGGKHEGPLLTDTIMFASIDPEKKKVTLISIPRDFWVTDKQAKINTIYAYSESALRGSGLQQTKHVVSEILGQKIDYGFRIDFNGFIKAVDMVGGVDVNVARSFDDYAYPVTGKENDLCGRAEEEIASLSAQIATGSATDSEFFPCRFEHLHFDAGLSHMDGEAALKFVRSRHALGPEGTDFARSKRQEKVIRAVKDKVFSAGTFLNPVKIVGLLDIFKDSIDTDIKEDELDDFIKLAKKLQNADIYSIVLDVGDAETNASALLINPPTGEEFRYQWVIVPRVGSSNYTEIHQYVYCSIKYGDECIIPPSPVGE